MMCFMQAMVQAIDVLTSRIEDGDVEPSEAAEAVATLKRLEDEGVPAATGIDGVSMLLRAQTHSISEKITAIRNNIIEALKVAEKDSTHVSGASNTEFILGKSSLYSDNIQDGSLTLVLTVTGWMAEICKIMMRPSTDSSINWKHHEEEFKRALFTVFDAFETESMGIQSHLIKSSDWIVIVTNGNTVGLFQAMAQGHQLLTREEMPSFMMDRFSDIVSKLVRAVWDKVDKSLCFAARSAAISQSWTASRGCMSKAAAQLRLILVHGLDFILTLQAECLFAMLETSESTSSPMRMLCNIVCCFTDGIAEFAKQEIDLDSSSRQNVRQLLHGWQVLETLVSVIVPFIAEEPDFLKSTSDVSEANELLSGCHEHVKASALGLIGMYLDQKLKEIDKIMENLISNSLAELGAGSHPNMQDVQPLIQSWGLNCLPARANPSVWSLLTSITSVGSEISAIAEPLHTDVLSELLDRIGKGFEELMKSQVLDSMSSLSLQQLWLDLTIFVESLSNMEAKGVSLMSLQTFLSNLEATVIQTIQSSESNSNSGQWNQSGGDVRRWIERQCISEVQTAKLLTR
jgi:hypothetical protein